MNYPTALWCRSRRGRALCTRPAGHAGLHNRQGTSQLWSDAEADAPRCAGSGQSSDPAPALPSGFPGDRALCPECTAFVGRRDGRLEDHDTFRRPVDRAEAAERADWFNSFGWN